MKNKLSYILFILFFISSCFSDEALVITGAISGSVKESGSGKPIEDANVSLSGGESVQSALTDSSGNFLFGEITSGMYVLDVDKKGYLSASKNSIVNPEKTSISSFSLQKKVPVAQPNSINLNYKKQEEDITLTNKQIDKMDFTASLSKEWLSVSPSSGSIDPSNSLILKVSADFSQIEPGDYDETMVINVDGASLTIPVKINYVDPPYINITKPKIDEVYKMGDIMPIAWTSNMEGKVKVQLLQESSIVLNITTDLLNQNGGTYNWAIPSIESSYYKLLISSIELTNITNTTEPFKIDPGATKPIVSTGTAAEEIGVNYIKIKGNILDLGTLSDQVNDYGHVYSINSELPTIADSKTSFGISKEVLSYTSNITELQSANSYKIRAYATNNKGTSYGDVVSVTTTAGAPILSTTDATEITNNSAKSGGNISNDGGGTITERGLLYGKDEDLTIDSPKIIDSNPSTGSYVLNLTNLERGSKYYIKAYAKNSGGYGFGNLKSFNTIGDLPTVETISIEKFSGTKAEIRGKVVSNGGEPLSSYGFAYGKSSSPTISDNKVELGNQDIESFNGEISELSISTKYFVRAYATNPRGTSYGQDKEFTTTNGLPGVTTVSSESINGTNAKINGTITDNGGVPIESYGFVYAETENPTVDGFKFEVGKDGDGDFNGIITDLKTLTKYYVKAYATNSNGITYGEQIEITTTNGFPNVNTVGSRNIAGTKAVATGTLVSNGGSNLTSYGFVYSKSPNPTIDDDKLKIGTTVTDGFSGTITQLVPLTKYYYRAYASNGFGTSYGQELSFTTLSGMPTVSTDEIRDIGITNVKVIGTIVNDGGEDIIEYGFVYSIEESPTIESNKLLVTENTDNVYEGSLSNLTRLTKYYVRAFVTNMAGTAYGDELSFTTKDGMPIVKTQEIKDIGVTNVTAVGKIESNGGESITEYGFVYSKNENPTTSDSKLVVSEKTDNMFEGLIENLSNITKYYVKAYAINKTGTSYGDELSFTTLDGPYLDFTAPILNQNVPVGNSFNITWNTNIEDGTVTIEHWIGTTKTELSNNTEFSAKSFAWAIPSDFTQGSDNFIKIITNSDVSKTYESPKFNISDLVYIPDDAFEQYLIDEKLDDKLDDYIPTAQALKLTTFRRTDVSAPITDLTGLDSFTNLEVLSFDSNANLHVNDIDLSTLTKLKDIRLDGNSDFKLNSVILPKTESLTELILRGHNIKTIDFKDIPKLNYLNLNDSSYEVLDVSMLTSLNSLILRNNKLDRIDVSKITPQQFYITNNPLTCIQVSQAQLDNIPSNWDKDAGADYSTDCGFIYVPDDVFESNLIQLGYDSGLLDNYVDSRNIKDLTKLTLQEFNIDGILSHVKDMTGIEGFKALEELIFDDNVVELASLDLSGNINLKKLFISAYENPSKATSNGTLSSIDLSKNTELTELTLQWQNFESIDLSKNTKLVMLDMHGNDQLSSIDLSNNVELEKVDLEWGDLELANTGISNFEIYGQSTGLTTLDLSNNTKLSNLNLKGNRLTSLNVSNNYELTNSSSTYGARFITDFNLYLRCITMSQDMIDNKPVDSNSWSSRYAAESLGGVSLAISTSCDYSWNRIASRYNTGGILNSGSGNYVYAQNDIDIDSNGKIYLTGKGVTQGAQNGILSRGSSQKSDWEVLGNTLSSNGDLENPSSIFVANNGMIYVSNYDTNTVVKKDGDTWSVIADSSDGIDNPTDVWVTDDGTVYIVFNGNGTSGGGVIKKGPDDSDWSSLDLTFSYAAADGAPQKIKVLEDGTIYVLSTYAQGYLAMKDSDGNWSTIANASEDWEQVSTYNYVRDFDLDSNGDVYISLNANNVEGSLGIVKKKFNETTWTQFADDGIDTGIYQFGNDMAAGNIQCAIKIENGILYFLGSYDLVTKKLD